MAWQALCPACMDGNHERHVRDWNIKPVLIGGAWCPCPDQETCRERAEALYSSIYPLLAKEDQEAALKDRGYSKNIILDGMVCLRCGAIVYPQLESVHTDVCPGRGN